MLSPMQATSLGVARALRVWVIQAASIAAATPTAVVLTRARIAWTLFASRDVVENRMTEVFRAKLAKTGMQLRRVQAPAA
jgi:hypothetical protein